MANSSISRVRKNYTPRKPTVSNIAASAVTGTTATAGGNVTSQGTAEVTSRGICYGTSNYPTTSGTKVVSGAGTGIFSANITGLTANTLYYFRAYATNSVGTSYGSNSSFTTVSADLPIVATTAFSAIFNMQSVGGGNVTSAGASSVTSRGVCYSLSPNTTISNSIVASGSGTGFFTSNLTGLTPSTLYYCRAYAVNSSGVAYGSQVTFTTTAVATVQSGCYIPDFSDILGGSSAELALSNFQQDKDLAFLIFYLASLLDDSGNRTALRAFFSDLSPDISKSANVTQSINAITLSDAGTPAAYNAGCATAIEKFDAMSQEWEFWKSNPYGNFGVFATNDIAIYNFCQENDIEYNIYVARCRDVAGVYSDTQVADHLVAYHENIYLVDYVSTSKYNQYQGLSAGIQAQIQLIADAANRAGKVQNMIILWAANGNVVDGVPTNMRTFFQANPSLIPAYNGFSTVYNGWEFTNKEHINMRGQNIYSYEGIFGLVVL